jgi:acetolactate synthase-1/2/3 large subunit
MAEAFGQLTGRPAACLATRAVGAANLAIGLHTARQDSTPLIALVGQVPRAFRGREAFQEVDQVQTFGRLCKAAVEIDDPARLASGTLEMVQLARSGRPGPVLIALPEDVLDEPMAGGSMNVDASHAREDPAGDVPPADRGVVQRGLELVSAAERPVLVAGAGVLRAEAVAALVRFAEAAELPVMAAWRRPDAFPNDHRLYLGMAGLGAPGSVRERLAAADLILAVGTRLSEITTYGYSIPSPGARLVQVDLEPGFSGDRRQPDLAVAADAGAFLELGLDLLEGAPSPSTDARRQANDADRRRYLAETEPPVRGPGGPVDPAAVIRALREQLPPDSIVTTDAGNFGGWAARYLRFRPPGRFLGPTSGAMGYGLPAAIAAALADPQRPVVALAGDGGFAMLMAELETAVREGLRLVAVVFDNRMYGTIRMHQEEQHPGRVIATDLGPIDLAAVARACGAQGLTIDHDDQVGPALTEALSGQGVTVLHLLTDPRYLSVDRMLSDGGPIAQARGSG